MVSNCSPMTWGLDFHQQRMGGWSIFPMGKLRVSHFLCPFLPLACIHLTEQRPDKYSPPTCAPWNYSPPSTHMSQAEVWHRCDRNCRHEKDSRKHLCSHRNSPMASSTPDTSRPQSSAKPWNPSRFINQGLRLREPDGLCEVIVVTEGDSAFWCQIHFFFSFLHGCLMNPPKYLAKISQVDNATIRIQFYIEKSTRTSHPFLIYLFSK